MLVWDRTPFFRDAGKVFHICSTPSAASALAQKYGADSVFYGTSHLPFLNAINAVVSGRNDVIKVHPGTYTFTALITTAKVFTLEADVLAPGSVVISGDGGTKTNLFSFSGSGVVLRGLTFVEASTGTANMIASTGAGTVVEDCVVRGGGIVSANASLYLNAIECIVRRCRVHDTLKGILVGGSRCLVEDCLITTSANNSAYFGISTGGTSTGIIIRNNTVYGTGAAFSGITIAASTTLTIMDNNKVSAATRFTNTGTAMYFQCIMPGAISSNATVPAYWIST